MPDMGRSPHRTVGWAGVPGRGVEKVNNPSLLEPLVRTRTSFGAAALALSLAAVAFGPVLNARTTDGIRMHEQKHAQFDAKLVFDPLVVRSSGPADCLDTTENGIDDALAGQFPCDGVDMLSFTHVDTFGPSSGSLISSDGASDVWGWTSAAGEEFVILGKVTGVTFLNVTDPTAPLLLGNLNILTEAQGFIWYDIKVVGDHAYIVSETPGAGLLVFDMTQLIDLGTDVNREFVPSSVYPLTGSAHNIVANEAAETVYVVGGNNGLAAEDICRAGLHAIDVSSPTLPTFAGCYLEEGGYGVVGSLAGDPVTRQLSRYVHDAQCARYSGPDTEHGGKDICITSAEDHVSIVDMSNPLLPTLLSTVAYESPAYTHQGWLSPDMATFYLGDELDEEVDPGNLHTRTIVLDVSDLDAPKVSFVHEAAGYAIDHNMYTAGDALFQSNYSSGLRILDTSKVVTDTQLTEVAYFDVRPSDNSTTYSGTWSNYPYFESGNVVISGYDGVWMVRLHDDVARSLSLR
jgi:choice-of-anchor B domain-containing protein